MTILTAPEIKAWDQFTIKNEPVSSIDLMERAAQKCMEWVRRKSWKNRNFKVFCGKGNNGGDGLALSRLLYNSGYNVSVYILEFGKMGSEDFQSNLQLLHHLPLPIHFIQTKETIPYIEPDDLVVDALYGNGLHGPLFNLSAEVVKYINNAKVEVISIDLPSGLYADKSSKGNTIIEASYTLSFQCYKLGLLLQENASYIGIVEILDIGLDQRFLDTIEIQRQITTANSIRKIFRPRPAFAHKGRFGHALIISGSYGKIGAAILCTKACIRSGVGLVTCFLPQCGYSIMQTSVPEAMVITDENQNFVASLPGELEKYQALGIGPGLGTAEETQKLLSFVVRRFQKPLVVDADALNCLSMQPALLQQLPAYSILSPHPKEFDRLFGPHDNDFDRMETSRKKSMELHAVIVLKGHHTMVTTPEGKTFFNNTGNAGMAKGGSGDVLTGILTALLAQGYSSENAAILAVYIHGIAGDIAAETLSQEGMIPSDLINFLPGAFLKISAMGKNFPEKK